MAMLGAFQALLMRYTGREDVAVGCPRRAGTVRRSKGLIGFFVNTLVLRVDSAGGPSFRAVLAG